MPRKKSTQEKLVLNILSAILGRKKASLIVGIIAALGGFGLINLNTLTESNYQHYQLDSRFRPWFTDCSKLLDKFYYLNCYDYHLASTKAVAYALQANLLQNHESKRPQFETDVALPKYARTEWSDYLHSGYDRGHTLSNQSMNANKQAQAATFLMSNITPQWPQVNQGIWLEIEKRERLLASRWGAANVLNVVYYDAHPKRLRAGNRPAIPKAYAKAICHAQLSKDKDGHSIIAAGNAAAKDLSSCECYLVPNVKYPKQINASDARINCANLS